MPLGTAVASTPKAGAVKVKTKAASNRIEFDVRGESTGVLKHIGVIDSLTPGTLLLSYKRHGSTKYEIKPIPLSKILMIRGDVKQGGTVEVTFQSEKAIFTRIKKVAIIGFDDKLGMTKGEDEEGRPLYIRPDCCNAVSMTEIAAPAVAPPRKY